MVAARQSPAAAFSVRHRARTLDGVPRKAENLLMENLRALLLGADDDRRAIERGLHDGIQQQLVALAVTLQVARGLVEDDPQAAARLLDDMQAQVAQALLEVRQLAQDVHPPLFDTQGLIAALRMAASASPIPARIDGAVDADVPPELALTVYRCCVMTLAAASGENARATVSVRAHDGVLEFEIVLTGARVGRAALEPIAARVRALGGVLEIVPSRVVGRLPVMS
jgi:signal transduction histidine kinase